MTEIVIPPPTTDEFDRNVRSVHDALHGQGAGSYRRDWATMLVTNVLVSGVELPRVDDEEGPSGNSVKTHIVCELNDLLDGSESAIIDKARHAGLDDIGRMSLRFAFDKVRNNTLNGQATKRPSEKDVLSSLMGTTATTMGTLNNFQRFLHDQPVPTVLTSYISDYGVTAFAGVLTPSPELKESIFDYNNLHVPTYDPVISYFDGKILDVDRVSEVATPVTSVVNSISGGRIYTTNSLINGNDIPFGDALFLGSLPENATPDMSDNAKLGNETQKRLKDRFVLVRAASDLALKTYNERGKE